jgi:phosphopantetheinyl transferase
MNKNINGNNTNPIISPARPKTLKPNAVPNSLHMRSSRIIVGAFPLVLQLQVSYAACDAGCVQDNDANRTSELTLQLPHRMAHAPAIRRIIELYAPDQRISAPKARLILAQNRIADASLSSLRAGCRFLLQRLLCRTSGPPRTDWKLHYAASGAPFLSCNGAKSAFNVSISHSSQWLAVGLSMGARIGVDVERLKPRKNFPAMAGILGWKDKVRDLSDFLSKWTLWEAGAKCVGSSSLIRPNEEFERLDHRDADGRVGSLGCWNGLHDRLDEDTYYAIVLNSQHSAVLTHRHLEPAEIKPW